MSPSAAPVRVFVDLRPLQDPNYQFRGVGGLITSLLRNGKSLFRGRIRLEGLLDPDAGSLPREFEDVVDDARPGFCPIVPGGSVFLSPSPMTHDPSAILPLVGRPDVVSAAVVYDFIPMDRDGYLPTPADRRDYIARLFGLKLYDRFYPISHYSARRLREITGVGGDRVRVVGAPVRSVYFSGDPSVPVSTGAEPPYLVVVGGADWRKNVETAVKAVSKLNQRRLPERRIALKVVGHYPPEMKDRFREHLPTRGGTALEFLSGLSDEELLVLYKNARALIAPSHIEGFSLPIVEALAAGCPVICSDCDAQAELVLQPEALFPSTQPEALADRLSRFLGDPGRRADLLSRQRPMAGQFHEGRVAERFWLDLLAHSRGRFGDGPGPRPVPRRMSVAFLTPYPPDESGVAEYSRETLREADHHMDVHLYTDTCSASLDRPLAGRLSAEAFLKGTHDAVVSVVGNSSFHFPILRLFERFGGPCILHDSRLTQAYFRRLGPNGFLQFAEMLLRRAVLPGEIDGWLQDINPPTLFLEQVVRRASPLIVHSEKFKALIAEKYGVTAVVVPFALKTRFSDEDLLEPRRKAARERLGVPPGDFLVATFGYVSGNKGLTEAVMALELLVSWGIPARLHFVGSGSLSDGSLADVGCRFGLEDRMRFFDRYVSNDVYTDYLLAADAAVQLRGYGWGQPSGALTECIGAGLPTVANHDLADSCDAPPNVRRVPDGLSPLLIAEALAGIRESGGQERSSRERSDYCRRHNFAEYAARLKSVLETAWTS